MIFCVILIQVNSQLISNVCTDALSAEKVIAELHIVRDC